MNQQRLNHLARCRAILLGSIVASLLLTHAGWAANNPLDVIQADSFSEKSPGIKTEACSEGGKNVCSIHDGEFLKYSAYDFDRGVAAFKAHIASTRPGTVEVRLDSVHGVLMGKCEYRSTGGWQNWVDITCNLDNSQSGVRDIYLVFHGAKGGALANVIRFQFLKSVVVESKGSGIDLSSRLDVADDEPQAVHAWGMPESGFGDNFDQGLTHWTAQGFTAETIDDAHAAVHHGTDAGMAWTPDVYINKTDVGGEWRTMALASLWWTSDGSKNFTDWKKSDKTVGDIFGNCRIQEIVDLG